MRKSVFCLLLACLVAGSFAAAQEHPAEEMTPEIYYLVPEFSQGTVYFNDRGPAEGLLNICAVDHTLRFMDDNGQELSASDVDNVSRVVIGDALFIRANGFFYRMYPVSSLEGIALKREVKYITDGKQGAYGTVDRTSSIRDYKTIYGADGVSYQLQKDKKYPFEVNERLFLYKGKDVLVFNKRNLKKLFPDKKEEIDQYFKSGHSIPGKLDEALELLNNWNR